MIRKYRFRYSTGYVGGTLTEEVEMDFYDDDDENYITTQVDAKLKEWIDSQLEPSWEDITEE